MFLCMYLYTYVRTYKYDNLAFKERSIDGNFVFKKQNVDLA